jgi:transcription elongation factor Elf1
MNQPTRPAHDETTNMDGVFQCPWCGHVSFSIGKITTEKTGHEHECRKCRKTSLFTRLDVRYYITWTPKRMIK